LTREIHMHYHDLTHKVWKRMVDLVGVHAVLILVSRAVWDTERKYEQAKFIYFDEEGISLDSLVENVEPRLVKEIFEEFFGSLVSILTRLVGRDITEKLANEIDAIFKVKGGSA
jgi:hypothetical protein